MRQEKERIDMSIKLKNINTKQQLLNVLGISEPELLAAISLPYKKRLKITNGKIRHTDKPNKMLKIILKKILVELQKIEPAEYCQCGFKGQNNIKNAKQHLNQTEVITLDVHACFQNSKAKYVRQFFEDKLNISGEALEILMQLTTYKGYLPTGANTSPALLFFSHEEIFNKIYNRLKKQDIKMTLYMDDFTISAAKHISGKVVKYIQHILAEHELHLNYDKIKRFGPNIAYATGIVIKPNGKIDIPFKKNHEIVKILEQKKIKEMNLKEIQKLLGKINYIQQVHPKRFLVTKREAIKQLCKLAKNYIAQPYE